jgi:hypothetical protein
MLKSIISLENIKWSRVQITQKEKIKLTKI